MTSDVLCSWLDQAPFELHHIPDDCQIAVLEEEAHCDLLVDITLILYYS